MVSTPQVEHQRSTAGAKQADCEPIFTVTTSTFAITASTFTSRNVKIVSTAFIAIALSRSVGS